MGIDLSELHRLISDHGCVARVVVATTSGSVPREVGASMLIWSDGQLGTIGGGSLEWEATAQARRQISDQLPKMFVRHALGPNLGQCCGGSVGLLTELFDAESVYQISGGVFVRSISDPSKIVPAAINLRFTQKSEAGHSLTPELVNEWMIEPVNDPRRCVWVWGAGHVGRAIIRVLLTLPDLDVTWVDTNQNRFPENVSEDLTILPTENPALLCSNVPRHAEHYIVTYSHALDLEVCHRLLDRGFRYAGLIGSETKWARFRRRLISLGHAKNEVAQIQCPIGDKALGKHPARIAIGVAREFLTRSSHSTVLTGR
ncbi:MAG: xanthine dehydrogenase accessory protein XdhC [Aestuariivita sp.]|nr:xanthine dehydrogenase accessory protein XdhC [Aestuariivita sp.]MCY4346566.1 xanthine dehydrogenase accessory protein XdhC [Aestuariivita sp.]